MRQLTNVQVEVTGNELVLRVKLDEDNGETSGGNRLIASTRGPVGLGDFGLDKYRAVLTVYEKTA